MQRDLVVVGGRRKSDPPMLLLFGCDVGESEINAAAYLVCAPLRKGTKPRVDAGGRVIISPGLKPGVIQWQPITLSRCN